MIEHGQGIWALNWPDLDQRCDQPSEKGQPRKGRVPLPKTRQTEAEAVYKWGIKNSILGSNDTTTALIYHQLEQATTPIPFILIYFISYEE